MSALGSPGCLSDVLICAALLLQQHEPEQTKTSADPTLCAADGAQYLGFGLPFSVSQLLWIETLLVGESRHEACHW